jgi:hypothetical protein
MEQSNCLHPIGQSSTDTLSIHNKQTLIGQPTHTRRSDGVPEPDGDFKTVGWVKLSIIVKSTLIDQTQSLSCPTQSTIQTTSTKSSVVYYFCILTVNYRVWLMNYRRNRVNFVSVVPLP